jgi:hypothetical protein
MEIGCRPLSQHVALEMEQCGHPKIAPSLAACRISIARGHRCPIVRLRLARKCRHRGRLQPPRSIPNVQRGRGGCLQRRSRQRTAANPDVHRRRTQSRRCLVLSIFGNAIARICRLLDRQFGALWHPCWPPVDRSGRGSGIARRFMGRRLDVNAGRATGAASAVDECGSRGNSRSTRQSARLGE